MWAGMKAKKRAANGWQLSAIGQGVAESERGDTSADLGEGGGFAGGAGGAEYKVDGGGNLDHIGFDHAAGGHGGGTEANPRRLEG